MQCRNGGRSKNLERHTEVECLEADLTITRIFALTIILRRACVPPIFDNIGKALYPTYSSVPNRSAGGKIFWKINKRAVQNKTVQGEFLFKIDERACTSIHYTRVVPPVLQYDEHPWILDAVGSSQIFFPTQNLERAY